MSRDKEIYEARRWFDTAMEDLDAAKAIMDKWKKGCFRPVLYFDLMIQ
jgi:hypothetical protein